MRHRLAAFLFTALFIALAAGESGAARQGMPGPAPLFHQDPGETSPADSSQEIIPNEFVVRLRPSASALQKQNFQKKWGAETILFPRNPARSAASLQNEAAPTFSAQFALVKVQPQGSPAALLRELTQDPRVLYAEPNYRVSLVATPAEPSPLVPDDFDFPGLWGLRNTGQTGGKAGADIKAASAWRRATGSRAITVAVIDTGIDFNHPDLLPNLWINSKEIPGNGRDDDGNGFIDDSHGYDFVSNDSDPLDDHGHGTHVAGTIGASGNNQMGIAGVCWDVSLMAIKAFDETGNSDMVRVIEGIHYAIKNGARIINASWGSNSRSRALEDAVRLAVEAGVVFVAAAGNEKTETPLYPAAYPLTLSVAATDHNDQRAVFSNFGAHIDVAAPGGEILSTLPDASFGFFSGTSMAAPHVSGLLALILSQNPSFTGAEIQNIVKNTADPLVPDRYIGTGRINAFEALLITSPLPIAELRLPNPVRGRVDIVGTAIGPEFQRYTLSHGKGSYPTNWTEIHSSASPITDASLLSDFDTALLDEGPHTFRLSVFNQNGQRAKTDALVQVENVQITFPLNNDLLRAGEKIPIRGAVFGRNRSFNLKYGKGWQPREWLDQGITLADGGRAEKLNEILAIWDTASVQPNEFYTLKLTAQTPAGDLDEHLVHLVYLDDRLKPGWPQYIPIQGEYPVEDWRYVKVADIDGDGKGELILLDHGNYDGKKPLLMAFRYDGALLWSKELPGGPPYADIPVVGDMNNDGFAEIFVDVGAPGQLFGFQHDGANLPGKWPVALEGLNLGKVLADLDGDGFKELIGLSQNPVTRAGGEKRQLLVFNQTGDLLREWTVPFCWETNDVGEILPAVGNLDDDPDLEIVIVSGCYEIAAFDFAQPAEPLWTARTDGILMASPAVGDINDDGRNEIVVGAHAPSKHSPGGLYAFDRTGLILPGWPVLVQESFSAAPALADFDDDGDLEISIPSWTSQLLHLVHHHGFEADGWPVGLNNKSYIKSSSVVGDINNDGVLDVVVATPGYWFLAALSGDVSNVGGVKAWSANGIPLDLNFQNQLSALVMEGSAGDSWLKAAPVTLTDIDGNGKIDIIASSIQDRAYAPLQQPTSRKNRSSIYVWELNVPHNTNAMPWPTFQGNSQHTGYFKTQPLLNQPPRLAPIPDQVAAPGQPFYPIELDGYAEDPDGTPAALTWTIAGARFLRFSISPSRVVTLTPSSPQWTGKETILFTATDPHGASQTVAATYEIRPGYNPPQALPDQAITDEDASIIITPLSNDSHPQNQPLAISHITKPRRGAATIQPGATILFQPAPNFHGIETFHYFASDGAGGMAMGAITVTVQPVNDPPAAAPDRIITAEDTPALVNILENDSDVEGDPLDLVNFTQPQYGSVTARGVGLLEFTPAKNWHGVDSFTYQLADIHGAETEGTVAIMVKPENDPPVAKGQSFVLNRNSSQTFDYIAHDSDADELTFKVIQEPEHGVLWTFPKVATYYPKKDFSGTDTLTYIASDGQSSSPPVSVVFTVQNLNNPPTAEDQAITTKPNRILNLILKGADLDEDPLIFEILAQPSHGALTGAGSNWVYRPTPDFIGADTVRYTVSDGFSTSSPAAISIAFTDKNTAPIASNSSVETRVNTPVPLTFQATDGESDPLGFQIVSEPSHGTIAGTHPNLRYVPRQDYEGSDRFTFRANDGSLDSGEAEVTVQVKNPNTPPVATPQTIYVLKDQPAAIRLEVTDEDGDPLLSCPILKGPHPGKLRGQGLNWFYTPAPGFIGSDKFTYKAWDGKRYSNRGEVFINVIPPEPTRLPTLKVESISSNGQVLLSVQAAPANAIQIQTSSDLKAWSLLHEETASNGVFSFADPTPLLLGQRFYRLIIPSPPSNETDNGFRPEQK